MFSCSTDELIIKKMALKWQLPSEKIEFKNYDNSNIDYMISPVNLPNKIKRIKSVDSNDTLITYNYEIETKYPSWNDTLITKVIIEASNDSITVTHFDENLVFAKLTYNSEYTLLKVTLPSDTAQTKISNKISNAVVPTINTVVNQSTLSYACFKKEYKIIKEKIESDPANDITCKLTGPFCTIMTALNAVEVCRGNIKR